MTTTKKAFATVHRAATAALAPQTAITIAVDTAYIASQQGQNITKGIYMMDNRLRNGSSAEGNLELTTVCNDGDLIGFNVVPINALGSSGDAIVITGFTVEPPPGQSGVFTAAGNPRPQPALPGEPAGAYWIGQAMAQGSQTYQIQVEVTVGLFQGTRYFVNWDPHMTSN